MCEVVVVGENLGQLYSSMRDEAGKAGMDKSLRAS